MFTTIPCSSAGVIAHHLQEDRVGTACKYLLNAQYSKAEELLRNPSTAQEKGLYATLIGKDSVYKRVFGFTAFDVNEANVLAKEVLPHLQKGVKEDALSARILGSFFYTGIGVEKDFAKAFQYYLQAAEANEPMAMNNVGVFYLNGIGVDKDKKKGVDWIRRAAARGNTIAMCTLADLLQDGVIVRKNKKRSEVLYAKTAMLGNAHGMFITSLTLQMQAEVLKGEVPEVDGRTRRDRILRAKIKKIRALESRAKKLREEAAKVGYVPAATFLAESYKTGTYGYERSEGTSLQWYKQAADSGLAYALLSLARCYEKGIGTSQKSDIAEHYYEKAHEAAKQQGDKQVLKETSGRKIAQGILTKRTAKQGTGFLVSESGIVVTNYHVVAGQSDIQVLFPTQNITLDATVQLKDTSNDLVVLRLKDFAYKKVSAQEIPYTLETSRNVKLAEQVFTLGFPLGEVLGKRAKFSIGTISSLEGFRGNASLFQISNPVQPGNSGGPLFNKEGNLVGVVVSRLSPWISERGIVVPQNVNFAVKSDYLMNLMSMIPEGDTIFQRKGQLSAQEVQKQVEALVPYIVTVYAK